MRDPGGKLSEPIFDYYSDPRYALSALLYRIGRANLTDEPVRLSALLCTLRFIPRDTTDPHYGVSPLDVWFQPNRELYDVEPWQPAHELVAKYGGWEGAQWEIPIEGL